MNLSNKGDQIEESLLNKAGSTPLYDAMFLFIFPPLGIFSFVGNLLSFRIFSAKYFQKKPLYTYLRVCCVNSALINIIFAFAFICDSRRYLTISNTEFSTYFRCYFKIPFLNLFYFFGSVVDIVLAIERLVELTKLKDRFRRLNPIGVSLGLFFACLIVNAPFILIFEPKKSRLFSNISNDSSNVNGSFFYFYGESHFALSPIGKILKNIQYFIRDILTLLVLILINLICIVLFR